MKTLTTFNIPNNIRDSNDISRIINFYFGIFSALIIFETKTDHFHYRFH